MKIKLIILALCFCVFSTEVFAQQATKKEVLVWVDKISSKIMALDESDFDQQLEEKKQYFTEAGWEKFREALIAARIDDYIENNNANVGARKGDYLEEQASFVDTKTLSTIKHIHSTISDKDLSKLSFTNKKLDFLEGKWFVTIPLEVVYTSGQKEEIHQYRTVIVVVESNEPQNQETGFGIEQWISYPYK